MAARELGGMALSASGARRAPAATATATGVPTDIPTDTVAPFDGCRFVGSGEGITATPRRGNGSPAATASRIHRIHAADRRTFGRRRAGLPRLDDALRGAR